MHHHPNAYRLSCILAVVAFLGASAVSAAQRLPIYWQQDFGGFNSFEEVQQERVLALVEATGQGTPGERQASDGSVARVVTQPLRIVDSMPTVVSNLTCVVATGYTGDFFLADQLPQGTRFLALLLRPKEGKTTLRSNKTVPLQTNEVAGGYALPTILEALPTGMTFDEALFSAFTDSIAEYPFRNLLEFAERWPHPPGMNLYARGTRVDRSITPFLKGLSDRVAARGGLFSAVFHTRLGSWNIRGNADALMNSLLLNASDPRLEEVLTWRLPTVVDLDGRSQFSDLEAQERILDGAEGAFSDQVAALFVVRLEHPMRDFRERFLELLRRDMPKLRAQICNILAMEFDRPERKLPYAKDKEGWEQRVAEMSQTWLNELGG